METEYVVGQAFVMLKNVEGFKTGDIVHLVKQDGVLVLLQCAYGYDWWCESGYDCEPYYAAHSKKDTQGVVKDYVADPVNHPSHYTGGDIECIDAIRAALTKEEFIGFCRGQVIKYTWRMNNKGYPAQDVGKSIWYANKLIETLEEG